MLYKQIGKIEMEDKNMVKVIRVYGECLGALKRGNTCYHSEHRS